ncbi:FG-GAP repeat domain-containing protein, partial [Micromonospora chersina]|uniref:FG-GAP repeat domain-containing protein n=1 Tax=Micromonospora chersina TaxID=47854 RepID=UPI0037A8379D
MALTVVTALAATGLVALPGSPVYALPVSNLPVGNTPFGIADWDGNKTPDVVARDTDGIVWVYPGDRGFASQFQIGTGFGGYTPFGVADWTGDGHADLVIRNDADGSLVLYAGHGGNAPLSGPDRTTIGTGFGGYTPFGVADWTGDGHADLVIRNDADG